MLDHADANMPSNLRVHCTLLHKAPVTIWKRQIQTSSSLSLEIIHCLSIEAARLSSLTGISLNVLSMCPDPRFSLFLGLASMCF